MLTSLYRDDILRSVKTTIYAQAYFKKREEIRVMLSQTVTIINTLASFITVLGFFFGIFAFITGLISRRGSTNSSTVNTNVYFTAGRREFLSIYFGSLVALAISYGLLALLLYNNQSIIIGQIINVNDLGFLDILFIIASLLFIVVFYIVSFVFQAKAFNKTKEKGWFFAQIYDGTWSILISLTNIIQIFIIVFLLFFGFLIILDLEINTTRPVLFALTTEFKTYFILQLFSVLINIIMNGSFALFASTTTTDREVD